MYSCIEPHGHDYYAVKLTLLCCHKTLDKAQRGVQSP